MIGCFLNIFSYGFSHKAGVQVIMADTSYFIARGEYIERFFYDLIFFYLLEIVMNNFLLGILLDSFNKHRTISQKRADDIANKCFICGEKKDKLEKESINFVDHTSKTHNIWDYVSYLIFLRKSDSQELNFNNSYVKDMIENQSIGFFPKIKKGEPKAVEDNSKLKELNGLEKKKEKDKDKAADKIKSSNELEYVKEQDDE